MEVAGANVVGRFRFTQDRWDLPRHSSHVAQLFSLGRNYAQDLVLQTIL